MCSHLVLGLLELVHRRPLQGAGDTVFLLVCLPVSAGWGVVAELAGHSDHDRSQAADRQNQTGENNDRSEHRGPSLGRRSGGADDDCRSARSTPVSPVPTCDTTPTGHRSRGSQGANLRPIAPVRSSGAIGQR